MKKEILKSVSFILVCIIGIDLYMLGLKALNTYDKNRALDRCYPYGITEDYTNENNIYYACKVEK